MAPNLTVREGVFRIDGRAQLLLMGDYPYYRDDARNWPARLREQAEAGLDVLSCYVPWRHHAPHDPIRGGGSYDFEGATQANRDLVRLLEIAQENALRVVLKPGPFVHAELAYGGLPDYVDPALNADIEPELDAHDHPLQWPTGHSWVQPRSLPAPFDPTFLQYAGGWLDALAQRVLVGRTWPQGPVIALQVMNEGIYSDSSNAGPLQIGFSKSTLERYRRFCGGRSWPALDVPRKPKLLREPRDLLAYLDWSAFHGALYNEVAVEYAGALRRGGLDAELPIVFNFNPNIETYRTQPASNDGWYTRVNLSETEFTFGTTNWVGVVAGDAQAFRQYVMALTAFRGPCMEQNWGYSSQYFAPYEYVTPSHFESMLGLACGATGFAAYPVASTRAWRADANLGDTMTQARTNERDGDTAGDYPGNAAILSNGEKTPKYWTLMQMAQYLRSEGPRFVEYGPVAPIAWATYAPYAWAGQWLPRGDPDDILWRPPLKAIPRGAYHGLDSFVEMMTRAGTGFRQVEITRDTSALDRTRILCISGHEYMDLDSQERLASWVERGGRLLLTNVVADKDERMRDVQGPLLTRVFPHRVVGRIRVSTPRPLELSGRAIGKALEFAFEIEPPEDARPILRLGAACVGYSRPVGAGQVVFAGVGPWRAVHSGDDAALARENQELTWQLLCLLGAERTSAASSTDRHDGEVVVWQHGDPARDEQHVFVVVRETQGVIRIRVPRPTGGEVHVRLRSPSQSVHAFSLAEGRLRSGYLKGVNDLRGERVRPSIATDEEEWSAEDECDLCIVPTVDSGFLVSAAHLGEGKASTRVHGLPGAEELPVGAIEAAGVVRAPALRGHERTGGRQVG